MIPSIARYLSRTGTLERVLIDISNLLPSAGGVPGPQGPPGTNAYTTLTAGFLQPAVLGTVTVAVVSSAWSVVGQEIFVGTGGVYDVVGIPDPLHLTVRNTGDTGNVPPGSAIASGVGVSPSGLEGPQGTPGTPGLPGLPGLPGAPGVNAFTTTTGGFVQPAVGVGAVVVPVVDSSWIAIGQPLFAETGGEYVVTAVPDGSHVALQNTGATGNAAPGTAIAFPVKVSPSGLAGAPGTPGLPGLPGAPGVNAFTQTTAPFVQPSIAVGSVTVDVGDSSWIALGQPLFVEVGGEYVVTAIPDGTHVSLENTGAVGNAPPGTVIPSPKKVSPSGVGLGQQRSVAQWHLNADLSLATVDTTPLGALPANGGAATFDGCLYVTTPITLLELRGTLRSPGLLGSVDAEFIRNRAGVFFSLGIVSIAPTAFGTAVAALPLAPDDALLPNDIVFVRLRAVQTGNPSDLTLQLTSSP